MANLALSGLTLAIVAALTPAAQANWSFRGTPNGWAETAMTAGSGGLFTTCQTFASSDNNGVDGPRFKIAKAGGWVESYPTADQKVPEMGTYNVEFDSTSKAIKVTKVTACPGANLPPVAVISPDDELVVSVGDSLTLTASDSSDEDGEVVGYLWSNGDTTETSTFTFDAPGSTRISLTVTDDKGAKHEASLTISVLDPAKWYFSADSVNYSEMLSKDGQLCTQYTAASSSDAPRVIKGDLSQRLPASGGISSCSLLAGATYDVCHVAGSNKLNLKLIPEPDLLAPTATATPAAGRYPTSQSIKLSVSDDKDSAPVIYYTTDGSTPTTKSPKYSGQTITASETANTPDLLLRTLSVDASGNQKQQSFTYNIGAVAKGKRDFREETIYFLMTARFFDGEPDNNRYCRSDAENGNKAANDPCWRGDLQGLIQKLDYLKALGFTAVWITPPVLNRSDYDFHGYHAWDMRRIDERLGGDEVFQQLISEMHKRDMKLVMDIVLNHSSRYGEVNLQKVRYFGIQDEQWSFYYDDENPSFEYDGLSVEPNSGKNYYNGDLWTSSKPDLPWNNLPNWGLKQGIDHKTGRTIYHYQWPNMDLFNPKLYHNSWLKNWEDITAQQGTIHEDLPDLNTEDAEVQQYLIDTYCHYINLGVDAFRIDTVKHVSRLMFNRHFIPAFKECGGDDFFTFGEVATRVNEVWNKGVAPLSTPFYTWAERKEYSANDAEAVIEAYNWENGQGVNSQPSSDNHHLKGNDYHEPDYSKSSGLSVIDFPMHWNFSDAGSAINIASQDSVYNDATWNVVYVDSHDYGPNTDNRYAGGTEAWAENMSYMWTFRGIPTLYYGSEIEFKAGARADLGPASALEGTGRAYFGKHIEGDVTVSDFGVWSNATGAMATTLNSPLAKHLSRLNQIRRAVPALQKGQYSRENISGLAYKRRYTNAEEGVDSFALVAISGGATFSGIPNGKYVDVVTGDVKNVSNGTLAVALAGKGNMRVYVLDLPGNPAPGKIGSDGPFLK